MMKKFWYKLRAIILTIRDTLEPIISALLMVAGVILVTKFAVWFWNLL